MAIVEPKSGGRHQHRPVGGMRRGGDAAGKEDGKEGGQEGVEEP